MPDDLNSPLGGRRPDAAGRPASVRIKRMPFGRSVVVITFVLVAAAALRIWLVDDPQGGRPVAETSISDAQTANRVAGEVGADALSAPDSPDLPALPVEAVRAPGEQPVDGGPAIITLEAALEDGAVEEPVDIALNDFGALPSLIEESGVGPIPRISSSGETPFGSYARASIGPGAADGRPLVAVVITGLGLNGERSIEAVRDLPDNITLAFAPYGQSLDTSVGAAHAEGHEVMLEIPLEPFDYPANDPGPHTLLTGQPPQANLERLFWLMGRFGGYFGVVNHMGARFTASAGDFSPVMEEFGARGLAYLDDGSSNRSLAPQLAASNRVPFARAHRELDANPSRAAILTALGALEDEARRTGSAIGIATALPVSISTIAEWARGLEDSDLLLVPVSALMRVP